MKSAIKHNQLLAGIVGGLLIIVIIVAWLPRDQPNVGVSPSDFFLQPNVVKIGCTGNVWGINVKRRTDPIVKNGQHNFKLPGNGSIILPINPLIIGQRDKIDERITNGSRIISTSLVLYGYGNVNPYYNTGLQLNWTHMSFSNEEVDLGEVLLSNICTRNCYW